MSQPEALPSGGELAQSSSIVTSVAAMIAATRQRPAPSHASAPALALPGDLGAAIPLGTPQPVDARSLGDVIARRRSGGIASGPVDRATLAALLDTTGLPNLLAPEEELAPLVFPVVLDVEGIPAGAYRYAAKERALLPIAPIDRTRLQEDVLLQWEHGEGAAIFFLAVPLAAWLRRRGDRGYRSAAMAVGFVSDRLYLAAEGLGLTYTSTGGFAPRIMDDLFGLDGYAATTFFSFAIGARRSPERP